MKNTTKDIKKLIKEFEFYIQEYKKSEKISDARKLIQKEFKTFIDDKYLLTNDE